MSLLAAAVRKQRWAALSTKPPAATNFSRQFGDSAWICGFAGVPILHTIVLLWVFLFDYTIQRVVCLTMFFVISPCAGWEEATPGAHHRPVLYIGSDYVNEARGLPQLLQTWHDSLTILADTHTLRLSLGWGWWWVFVVVLIACVLDHKWPKFNPKLLWNLAWVFRWKHFEDASQASLDEMQQIIAYGGSDSISSKDPQNNIDWICSKLGWLQKRQMESPKHSW